MITYTIPENLSMPLYQYLYNCIKKDIQTGQIKANEKLPSKRNLAKQLQVSLITIENAYEQLIIEGYITSIEKKGYYVCKIDVLASGKPLKANTSPVEAKKEEYLMDFTHSSLSVDNFPFATWAKISRNVMSNCQKEILQSTSFKGSQALRKAIAAHLKSFNDVDVSYHQIILGAGSEYLYSLLVQLFGRKARYGLEDPGHHAIGAVYKAYEVGYSFIPLDEQGIDVRQLEKENVNVVHVSPNHHYPTGITMPISRRYDLLNWADKNDGYIIEDDYDSEFRLKGKPIPSLFHLDQFQRVVYMNTFSITLSSSFRMAYMVLPQRLLEKYQQSLNFYHCTIAVFEQLVLAQFITTGGFERHINRMRKIYRENRDQFIQTFKKSRYGSKVIIKEADSGLHFLLQYPYSVADEKVEQLALQIGVKIDTLSHYMVHKRNTQTLIIRYTGLSEQQCLQAVDLLNQLFDLIQKEVNRN